MLFTLITASGRFAGLIQRQLEGHEREFLAVEYDNADTLFGPVHQRIDSPLRRRGTAASPPSTISADQGWSETKERVKEAVQKVAEDLLDLYARRQVVEGFSFAPDSQWQKNLEDSSPTSRPMTRRAPSQKLNVT